MVTRQKFSSPDSVIYELLKNRSAAGDSLDSIKRKISKALNLTILSNVELLKAYHNLCRNKRIKPDRNILNLLKKRRVRSLSGVAIVAVLTKPYPCPGKCLYCPAEKGMPKSYLSNEPAVMRAILNKFDPAKQVENRLLSLGLQGHSTDKIELIVIGGTWSYLPKKYREWFITECFRECNEFLNSQNPKSQTANSNKIPNSKIQKIELLKEQRKNEKARHRIIGITVETRPDFIDEKEIVHLRKLGVTRVELGVQSIYDDVLKLNRRGHNVKKIIAATKLLKDAGLKVCYHIMPNLPGSDAKRDEKMFAELFQNPDFQPDLLKIYPCAILKEAPIYRLWKQGKYRPYAEKKLKDLLLKAKKSIPYYCRIQRLTRDIPSPSIVTGPAKISNLRQILARMAQKEGWRCKCIRCREVRENYDPEEKLYLFRQDYPASGGKEIFLSYENQTRSRLYSLLRLRIPSKDVFLPVLKNAAIIRELHTYGQLHPIVDRGLTSINSPQHKGLGKKLIKEAEKIAGQEPGLKAMAAISGVGVRNYYRKLGYKLKDTYMIKKLP